MISSETTRESEQLRLLKIKIAKFIRRCESRHNELKPADASLVWWPGQPAREAPS
jgi:hypothetical protein